MITGDEPSPEARPSFPRLIHERAARTVRYHPALKTKPLVSRTPFHHSRPSS